MANPIEEIEARVEAWYDDERNQIPGSAEQFAADIGTLLEFINRQREEIEEQAAQVRLRDYEIQYHAEQVRSLSSQLERLTRENARLRGEVDWCEQSAVITDLERIVERLKAEQGKIVGEVIERFRPAHPKGCTCGECQWWTVRASDARKSAALRLQSGGTTDV